MANAPDEPIPETQVKVLVGGVWRDGWARSRERRDDAWWYSVEVPYQRAFQTLFLRYPDQIRKRDREEPVEVLIDGVWLPGGDTFCWEKTDGEWWGTIVVYHPSGSRDRRVARYPDQVRLPKD